MGQRRPSGFTSSATLPRADRTNCKQHSEHIWCPQLSTPTVSFAVATSKQMQHVCSAIVISTRAAWAHLEHRSPCCARQRSAHSMQNSQCPQGKFTALAKRCLPHMLQKAVRKRRACHLLCRQDHQRLPMSVHKLLDNGRPDGSKSTRLSLGIILVRLDCCLHTLQTVPSCLWKRLAHCMHKKTWPHGLFKASACDVWHSVHRGISEWRLADVRRCNSKVFRRCWLHGTATARKLKAKNRGINAARLTTVISSHCLRKLKFQPRARPCRIHTTAAKEPQSTSICARSTFCANSNGASSKTATRTACGVIAARKSTVSSCPSAWTSKRGIIVRTQTPINSNRDTQDQPMRYIASQRRQICHRTGRLGGSTRSMSARKSADAQCRHLAKDLNSLGAAIILTINANAIKTAKL
mmetsp:Transcript_52710/g.140596  ORF Transcript_52710/g.140596 Transcript_52710/m.140596 type:complete len:410 (+) Transcript_52710:953-2182(+)